MREAILGHVPQDAPPKVRAFWDFFALIQENVRPRRDRLPVFTDDALSRLTMPVLAIIGGKDALFDSLETRKRIEKLGQGEVVFYPDTGHFIADQGDVMHRFLASDSLAL